MRALQVNDTAIAVQVKNITPVMQVKAMRGIAGKSYQLAHLTSKTIFLRFT